MSKSKHPAPIYHKPPLVPATDENVRAAFQPLCEPDPFGKLLDEWSEALRDFLGREGVPVLQRLPPVEQMLRTRETTTSVDGGFVCYRKGAISPGATEAIEALSAIEMTRRTTGDFQLLYAFNVGGAIERTRATVNWARAIHAGAATMRGGKKGAARAHGPHDQREVERERWRARFAELRQKFPTDPKKVLLGMIADETGETFRTLRRYIKQR